MCERSTILFLFDRKKRNLSLASFLWDSKIEILLLITSSVGESDKRKRLKMNRTANLCIFSRSLVIFFSVRIPNFRHIFQTGSDYCVECGKFSSWGRVFEGVS